MRLVRERHLDLVHGYEWPPALEAFGGPLLRLGVPVVFTVMGMAVAPFLPRTVPLVVGSADIRRRALAAGHTSVTLIEPPVDVRANAPTFRPNGFRAAFGLDPAIPLVAVVCRLVPELKLEGLLAACDAVARLASGGTAVQLVVVGDGPARQQVEERAAKANAAANRRLAVLTGALSDPRPAYAAADVMLGMGGSALRGLAFAKPLIVQGERGFWELLTPQSAPMFLDQGWYGVADDASAGPGRLAAILSELLADADLRFALGRFGRCLVVEQFSLDRAAAVQEEVYLRAQGSLASTHAMALSAEVARCGVGLLRYKVHRKWQRLRGTVAMDDFNTVAHAAPSNSRAASARAAKARGAPASSIHLPRIR
jgi:glycosyltransferase involved in cell wall biosynthesis